MPSTNGTGSSFSLIIQAYNNKKKLIESTTFINFIRFLNP